MATHLTPCALRARAHDLMDNLTAFATAPAALQRLFETFDDEKMRLVELVLHWQNRSAAHDIDAVVAGYDAPEAVSDALPPPIHRDMLLLVMGKPALLFATSIYDEELASLVWAGLVQIREAHAQFNLLLQALDNTRDSHGLSSLHYAIEAQMPTFFRDVVQHLAREDAANFRRAVVEIRSQDVVLPMPAKQITGKSISSGGCTLLHLAARKGELEIVQTLLEEPIAVSVELVGTDWDGLTPVQLAALHLRSDVVSLFEASCFAETLSADSIASLQCARDARAIARYRESMAAREPMTKRQVFSAVWSRHECEQVLRELTSATTQRGWSKQRHASYPTTDLPCYQVASIDAWVRSSIQTRLFTQVHEQHGIPPTKQLTFRELFYVKYEAQAGEQAELALHCDGSVLSFNILLNPASEFSGGGTYFEEADVTVHIQQGDAVVHSGKVRHAGAAVTNGRRTILVGFLDVVNRVDLGTAN